jgi:hypothetical protein
MTTTGTFPTADIALSYRKAHDTWVKKLWSLSMQALREIDRQQLAGQGSERLMGGPVTKDELVSAIVEREYPLTKLNEAIHAAHHGPDESWPACGFCAGTGAS